MPRRLADTEIQRGFASITQRSNSAAVMMASSRRRACHAWSHSGSGAGGRLKKRPGGVYSSLKRDGMSSAKICPLVR